MSHRDDRHFTSDGVSGGRPLLLQTFNHYVVVFEEI